MFQEIGRAWDLRMQSLHEGEKPLRIRQLSGFITSLNQEFDKRLVFFILVKSNKVTT